MTSINPELRQNNLFEQVHSALGSFFNTQGNLSAKNYQGISEVISRQTAIDLLLSITSNEATLQQICQNSYNHPLGFRKIVLLSNYDQNQNYELRMHIWWRSGSQSAPAVPIAEGRHTHGWSFASHMLAGRYENHRYEFREPPPDDINIKNKVESRLATLPKHDLRTFFHAIEVIAALDAPREHSQMLLDIYSERDTHASWAEIHRVCEQLGISHEEYITYSRIFVRYANQRVDGVEQYSPVGFTELSDTIPETVHKGEITFQPYRLAHRLVLDPQATTVTLVVVGPPVRDAISSELAMSPRDRSQSTTEIRASLKPHTLREEMLTVLNII